MSQETDDFLTKGLQDGYAGNKKSEIVYRKGFQGRQHTFYGQTEDETYIDEWFASRNGGGQELASANDEDATRLYAGGIISEEEMRKLNITEEDIIQKHLIPAVNHLGGKTRLHEPSNFHFADGWDYTYEILHRDDSIDLTIGLETIKCQGTPVFKHGFLNSPIK